MSMVPKCALTALVCAYLLFFSAQALAQGMRFLSHGSSVKAAAGAGVTTASGPLAAFYNPAALMSTHQIEVFGEVAALDLKYSYKTNGFNSAKVRVSTPIATMGLGARISSRFALGAMLMPVPGGASKLTVKGVPSRQMSQEPGLIDVTVTNGKAFGYQGAVGAAFSLTDGIDIGAGGISFSGDQDLSIADSETGQEILGVTSSAKSFSVSAGFRARTSNWLNLAILYKGPTQYSVSGRFLNEGGESISSKPRVGDSIVGSLMLSFKGFSPFVEVCHSRFSKNSGTLSPLAPQAGIEIENYDSTSFVVGSRFKFKPRHRISAAFGWYPTSVGSGAIADQEAGLPELAGIQFGDMDAISRKVYAGGYQFSYKRTSLDFSGAFHDGVREVPEYSRGFGVYRIQIVTFSSSIRRRL